MLCVLLCRVVILAFVFKLFQKVLYQLAEYQVVSELIINKNVNSPDYDKLHISNSQLLS